MESLHEAGWHEIVTDVTLEPPMTAVIRRTEASLWQYAYTSHLMISMISIDGTIFMQHNVFVHEHRLPHWQRKPESGALPVRTR